MKASNGPESRIQPSEFYTLPPVFDEGEVFAGRFEIDRKLGHGGQARVYSAFDYESGLSVALKLPTISSEQAQGRVEREIEVTKGLSADSDGVVPFVAEGIDRRTKRGPIRYLATEHMIGGSMAERIKNSPVGKLAVGELLSATTPAFRGVLACHDAGLVHRDIKTANIFLDGLGKGKIGDFGIVATENFEPEKLERHHISPQAVALNLTNPGSVVGTLKNMAPEILFGEGVYTTAVDVFDAGITLHYGLTGSHPIAESTTMDQHMHEIDRFDPSRIRLHDHMIPRSIGRLVQHCLEINPDNRPSMSDVVMELESITDLSMLMDDETIGIFFASKVKTEEPKTIGVADRTGLTDLSGSATTFLGH